MSSSSPGRNSGRVDKANNMDTCKKSNIGGQSRFSLPSSSSSSSSATASTSEATGARRAASTAVGNEQQQQQQQQQAAKKSQGNVIMRALRKLTPPKMGLAR